LCNETGYITTTTVFPFMIFNPPSTILKIVFADKAVSSVSNLEVTLRYCAATLSPIWQTTSVLQATSSLTYGQQTFTGTSLKATTGTVTNAVTHETVSGFSKPTVEPCLLREGMGSAAIIPDDNIMVSSGDAFKLRPTSAEPWKPAPGSNATVIMKLHEDSPVKVDFIEISNIHNVQEILVYVRSQSGFVQDEHFVATLVSCLRFAFWR